MARAELELEEAPEPMLSRRGEAAAAGGAAEPPPALSRTGDFGGERASAAAGT